MSASVMTAPQGVRLSSGRMTVVTAAPAFALPGYSIPAGVSGVPGTAAGAEAS